MELPKPNISTKTSGHIKEQAFGLSEENMGMIFDILRNKMYSNPIGAICREVASNSRDAHKEVGKEKKPIVIQLPSVFDPIIKFQDEGPGICPDRMTNVFLKYTASTKRDNNEQIGGFGIGAKTPFAYTDTFTIKTVVDGVKRIYTAYIDETQIGKMALSKESPTEEPNGTTIEVAVDKHDINKFCQEVIYATQYWEVLPTLRNNGDWRYRPVKKVLKGNDWYLTERQGYHDRNAVALISGIPYPIDRANIKDCEPLAWDVAENPVKLEFEIGDLTLIASRERIHYDEKTQKVLSKRLEKVAKEVIDRAKKDIEAAGDYIEARHRLAKHKGILKGRNITAFMKDLKWQGNKLLETIQAKDIGDHATIRKYVWDGVNDQPKAERSYQSRTHVALDIDDPKVAIYHNDRKAKTVSRGYVEAIFKADSSIRQVQIILTPADDAAGNKFTYDKKILKLIGTKKLSKITPVKRARTPGGTRYKKKEKNNVIAYKLDGHSDIWYNNVEIPNEDGGIYCVVDHSYGKMGRYRSELPNFVKRFHAYKEFLGEQIYGFTPTRSKKLSSNWKTVKEAVNDKVAEIKKKINFKKIQEVYEASHFLFEHHITLGDGKSVVSELDKNSLLARYYRESLAIKEIINKYSNYTELLRTVGDKDATNLTYCTSSYYIDMKKKDTSGLKQLLNEVNSRYPMLKLVERHSYGRNKDVIVKYIKQMDEIASASQVDSKGKK